LAEWEQVLDGPKIKRARFLAERSKRRTLLRHFSPLAGMLTEADRRTIYEKYSIRTYG